jgi:hypothetical protein
MKFFALVVLEIFYSEITIKNENRYLFLINKYEKFAM